MMTHLARALRSALIAGIIGSFPGTNAFPMDDSSSRRDSTASRNDSTLSRSVPDSLDQATPVPATKPVNVTRLAIIGGTMVATMAGIAIYQSNGYWKDNRAPFHFREDVKYALQVDKIAHFWDTALLGVGFAKAFEWADVPPGDAVLWGSGASLLFNTYTEIQDGLSQWGFDRYDWLADLGGALWPIAKYHLKPMQSVDLKWSYLPSDNLGAEGAFPGQKHLIFDDYEGYTFWLSLKLHDVLPAPVDSYWPAFLAVAVGYGARDITDPLASYPVWFLSFDYDMTRIIPQDTWFLRSLSEVLNYIHFPAPAVRISPSAIWYGLYF